MLPVSFAINHFNYDYTYLLQDHLSLASYCLLVISMISLYFFKMHFLRGVLFFLALLIGLYAGRIEWIGLPIILLFGTLFYFGIHAKKKIWRQLSFLVTLILSIAMAFVQVPGIDNWKVADKLILTRDAIPYSMALTFDKSLIGLFFLWFSPLSLAQSGKWKVSLKTGLQIGLIAVLVLIPLSYVLGYVKLDLKLTSFFWLWAIHNLFFTCIAEEAIFRGMILKSLLLRSQYIKYGKWVALVVSAGLFGLAHFAGGILYMILAFVAGLFYGYAFMKTEKIEASIIVHFMVNTVHFLAFTYPALKSAFV